jgi:FixJ family two-component response regulator
MVRPLALNASAFASAAEFLQSDRLNDTACLITDVQMPGMRTAKTVTCPRLLLAYHFHHGISRKGD